LWNLYMQLGNWLSYLSNHDIGPVEYDENQFRKISSS